MKLILGTLGALLVLGCDPRAADSASDVVDTVDATMPPVGGSGNDMDATPAPAGGPSDADLEGEREAGIDEMAPQVGEGGSCMPIDWSAAVSVCSPEPLLVSSDNYDGSSVSCREGCLLPWGCDDYDTARAKLDACVDDGSFASPAFAIAAQGCGYLTLVTIPRDPYQGFYDPDTKQLVAAFTEDDVGMVNCSGTLPMDCLYSYFGEPLLTDEVELCSGLNRDAGSDAAP